MQRPRRTLISAVLLLALPLATLHQPAFARRKPRLRLQGLPSGAAPSGPVLSRAQLRSCVADEAAIIQHENGLSAAQESIRNTEDQIKNLEARIRIEQLALDRYNQESVERFNKLIDRHQYLVETYNAALPDYNSKVRDMNAVIDKFNAACANHAYYESDMLAIKSGK